MSSCVLLRWYWGADCYGEQLWLHQGTRLLSLGSELAVRTGSGAVNVWEFKIKTRISVMQTDEKDAAALVTDVMEPA